MYQIILDLIRFLPEFWKNTVAIWRFSAGRLFQTRLKLCNNHFLHEGERIYSRNCRTGSSNKQKLIRYRVYLHLKPICSLNSYSTIANTSNFEISRSPHWWKDRRVEPLPKDKFLLELSRSVTLADDLISFSYQTPVKTQLSSRNPFKQDNRVIVSRVINGKGWLKSFFETFWHPIVQNLIGWVYYFTISLYFSSDDILNKESM